MTEKVSVSQLTHALLETKHGLYIAPERKVLASGRTSCVYFNVGDEVISYPRVKDLVVEALVQTYYDNPVRDAYFDRLVGVPEGANCLTSSLSDRFRIGQLRIRETQTDRGDQRSIEGYFEPLMTVAVFEDVMSTGGSTISRALNPLMEARLTPTIVIALIDRQYGGIPKMRELGFIARAFTTTTEIAECLVAESLVNDQQIRLLQEELEELKAV